VAGEVAPMPRAVAQGVRGVDGLSNCLEGVQLLVGVRKGVATLVIVTMPLDGVGVYTKLRRGVLGLASPKASRSSGPQSGEGRGIKAGRGRIGVGPRCAPDAVRDPAALVVAVAAVVAAAATAAAGDTAGSGDKGLSAKGRSCVGERAPGR